MSCGNLSTRIWPCCAAGAVLLDGTAAGLQSKGCSKRGEKKGPWEEGRSRNRRELHSSRQPQQHSTAPSKPKQQPTPITTPIAQTLSFTCCTRPESRYVGAPESSGTLHPTLPSLSAPRIGASGQFGHTRSPFSSFTLPRCRALSRDPSPAP